MCTTQRTRFHSIEIWFREANMQHADQVAYLERMLDMVRTNTRDDGPGISHTSVEEYFDPSRYQREVSLLFRTYPIVVAYSGQLRKQGDFVVHNDTGQPI